MFSRTLLFVLASLTATTSAFAARTEVVPYGLGGPVRFVYDSTRKEFIIEIENKDALVIHRTYMDANVDMRSNGFDMLFNEGAGKGLNMVQTDGTAFTTTANEFNYINYGGLRILHSPTVSGGTTTPVGIASYLDLGDGNATDDDADEFFLGGVLGASGRAYTVGRDPAFYTCATISSTDTADAEHFLIGFQAPGSTAVTAVPQNATLGSHIDYALIGEYDTAATCTTACPIYVLTGIAGTDVATDTTDVMADATDYELCVVVSAAGAVTYTNNGVAPTATAAATLSDGVQLVPYIKLKQNGTDDSDQLLKRWRAGFVETD